MVVAKEEGEPHVERDFRRYLECGVLAHGFARAPCGQCGHDLPVAFSCKGRGVCPSCNALVVQRQVGAGRALDLLAANSKRPSSVMPAKSPALAELILGGVGPPQWCRRQA